MPEARASVGLLRIGLALLVLVSLPVPFVEPELGATWDLVLTQVTPALVLMVVWVVLFDLLMARFLMGAKPPERRAHYRRVIALDLVLIALVLACWGPFFFSLLSRP